MLLVLASLFSSQLIHSHNDYAQKSPFDEAWENGFDSIEVDVFPVDGKLLVGHNEKDLNPNKTIESLYLDRMEKIQIEWNRQPIGGRRKNHWLLIDVKRDGAIAYKSFKTILARYPALSKSPDFKYVISGDRAIEDIAKDKGKFAGIDGRFSDLGKRYSWDQMPWISADWSDYFKWKGSGPIPADEFARMKELAAQVHKEHKLLRFWGAPDWENVWETQVKAGVDIINTDRLATLAKWRTQTLAKL